MITYKNYYGSIDKLNLKKADLPSTLWKGWDFVDKVSLKGDEWTAYETSEPIKRTVDLYFAKFEEFIGKKNSKPQVIQNKPKTNSTEYSQEKADKIFENFLDFLVNRIEVVWINEKLKSTAGLINFKKEMLAFRDWQPTDNANSFKAFLDKNVRLFKMLTKYVEDHEESHRKSDWADYIGAYQYFLSEARKILPKSTLEKKKSNTTTSNRKTVTKKKESNRPKKRMRQSANPNAKKVERITLELTMIRRYVNMHNKPKTRNQIRLFINSLQKAIRERRITKTSDYAKEITQMQSELIALHKNFKNDRELIQVKIAESTVNKFLPLLGRQVEMPSVKFIKSYINLQGKVISNKQAHSLHTRIVRAHNSGKVTKKDTYWNELESILEQLASFIEKNPNEGVLRIEPRALNGLSGIVLGCACDNDSLNGFDTIPERTILNSMEIVKLNFEKLNFKGKWREFIGNPSKGFSAMIFAKPKMGKSNLAIRWAGYLAKNHGTVLYVAKEEGIDNTLKDKLIAMGAAHPDLDGSGYLPDDLSGYDFVFLDSITKLGLTPNDLSQLEARYPNISFISIFQVTKSGNFRGNNGFQHEVDVVIEIPEKGKAIQYGRFNQGGEMDVFEQ